MATVAAAPFALSSLAFSSERCPKPHGSQLRRLACEEGQTATAELGSLRISFCGRPSKGYTPIFYDDPVANIASVNAGDYNLYVGGGSINLGFAKELGLPKTNGYQELHQAMLRAASYTPGRLVASSTVPETAALLAELGLVASFGRVPERGDLGPVGASFLDIFTPGRRPRSVNNVAMLYVVGPKGTGATGGKGPTVDSNEAFLKLVEEMAENALLAVAEYNAALVQDADMPRIEELQFCLVSGGVYMHPESTKADVAAAIVRGLKQAAGKAAIAAGSGTPAVRFAYDSGSFEDAVRQQS